jgi:hypothetical protein
MLHAIAQEKDDAEGQRVLKTAARRAAGEDRRAAGCRDHRGFRATSCTTPALALKKGDS